MEFEQILQLIDHVAAAGLKSFHYESGGLKLSLEGRQIWDGCPAGASGAALAGYQAMSGTVQDGQASQQPGTAGEFLTGQPADGQAAPGAQPQGRLVKSPLVGTFYAAPSEEGEPFVKVGDRIKKGQVLAIVEAMKLMNEIESEFDGELAEVFVQNGDAVEYGQPLFRIV